MIRTQADAREIAAGAERRLADEYDAAQERGEVATVGKRSQPERLKQAPPTAADIGVTRKMIHEARAVRNAERESPGIIRRTLKSLPASAPLAGTDTGSCLRVRPRAFASRHRCSVWR